MMRQKIRLSESQLNRIILNSAIRLIKESQNDFGMRQPKAGSVARRNFSDFSAQHYFGDDERNADARGIFKSRYNGVQRPDVAFNKDLTANDFDGDDLAQGMRDIDARYRRPSLNNDDELGYGC